MTKFTAPQDVVWVERPYIKMHDNPPPESQWEYKIIMPDWLAEWDIYGDWEVERMNSMRDNLKKGDILFDIGAEVGWQSVVYAQLVGAENMVLIEPSRELWPNIMQTWKHNFKVPPLACHYGLFSNISTGNFTLPQNLFPAEAEGMLTDTLSYNYIHEHGLRMPEITLDYYVELTGVVPDAITIDTEGSEYLIIDGAALTLHDHHPKVFISIHDELAEKDYGTKPGATLDYLKELGYTCEFLATDHESHWYCHD